MIVSIIIVNYNTFEVTCECIASILEFTRDIEFEIILVDNCSEVDAQEFSRKFPQVKVIKLPVNVGFAKGNNHGIAASTGDFVLLLNSDAVLRGNVIKESVDFITNYTDVAALTCRLRFPDGKIQSNCQRFPSIRYTLFELFRMQKILPRKMAGKILLGSFFDYNTVVYPDWIWGTFFLFKRSVLNQLPGAKLDDSFFMYGEDMVWCKEFQKRGLRVVFNPTCEVIHYMGGSKGKKDKMMGANLAIFMERYYSEFHRKLISFLDKLLRVTLG